VSCVKKEKRLKLEGIKKRKLRGEKYSPGGGGLHLERSQGKGTIIRLRRRRVGGRGNTEEYKSQAR